MRRYLGYGLEIESEIDLPELDVPEMGLPGAVSGPPDVHIRIVRRPDDLPGSARELAPGIWVTERLLRMDVADVASYTVTDGAEVAVTPAPGHDEASLRLFLLGTVFGTLLMQRGNLVLHGNVIRVGDACAVAVGHSGAGKSTLAAEFMRRGFDVLSDDVVPVDEHNRTVAGFRRIKLWQDTASMFDIDTEALERIRPQDAKFNVPVPDRQFASIPVRWVYLLDTHEGTELELEPLTGMQTFAPLRENTYRLPLLHTPELKQRHLEQCSSLAGQARVVRVLRPVGALSVRRTADSLLSDIAMHPPEMIPATPDPRGTPRS